MAYRGGHAAGGDDAGVRDVHVTWGPARGPRTAPSDDGSAAPGERAGRGSGGNRASGGHGGFSGPGTSAAGDGAAGLASAREDVRRVSAQMARDCLERTRAEVDELAGAGFSLRGEACAQVCLLKGQLSDEELEGGALLGGPDGTALSSALAALGYPDGCWAAISTLVRAPGQGTWAPAAPEELAWAVEVVDPELVVALDDEAAQALQAAFDVEAQLEPGEVTRVLGRRFLALGGFADALGDPGAKQLMWARLKRVPPLGDPL